MATLRSNVYLLLKELCNKTTEQETSKAIWKQVRDGSIKQLAKIKKLHSAQSNTMRGVACLTIIPTLLPTLFSNLLSIHVFTHLCSENIWILHLH